jgi:hypothetical protein
MDYQLSWIERQKLRFWRWLTPHFPKIRDFLLRHRVIWHHGRQDYRLGKIVPHKTPDELIIHLSSHGFGNHFVAWVDEGQLVSLRKLDNYRYQYHLRIFDDGEIRGHYELNPEYKAIPHFLEWGMEDRRQEFLIFLTEWVIVEGINTNSQSLPAASRD